jgi:TrmH family RNA methyltransferase
MNEKDVKEFARTARARHYELFVTAAEGGAELQSVSFPPRSLVVFGNESHGVSDPLLRAADHTLTIPKYGKADSLNVAISCGIILSRMRTQLTDTLPTT